MIDPDAPLGSVDNPVSTPAQALQVITEAQQELLDLATSPSFDGDIADIF